MSELSMEQVPKVIPNRPNLDSIIKDVARQVNIEQIKPLEKPKLTFSPIAQQDIKSADATTQQEFKKHDSDKVRKAFRFFIDKGRLALVTSTTLVAFGCGTGLSGGTAENPTVPSLTKEPIPSSATLIPRTSDDGVKVTISKATPTHESDTEGVKVTVTHAPTATPEPTRSTTPESPKPQEYEYLTFDNIKVAIDKEGIPISYVSPYGKEEKLDRVEMQKLKEQAILYKEPEIITLLTLPKDITAKPNYLTRYSDEHPRVTELPKDVLSDDELRKKGIAIVQSKNTSLYIRSSAFDADGPLVDFDDAPRKKLSIVLIDGPVVTRDFISDPNQPFARLLSSWGADVNAYRLKKIAFAEKELKMGRSSTPTDSQLLWLKVQLHMYKKVLTDKEIIAEMVNVVPTEGRVVIGRHTYEYDYERDLNENQISEVPTKRTTIFLAVGENYSDRRGILAFDRDGKPFFMSYWMQHAYDRGPQPQETHPNPSDVQPKGDNPYGYLYEPSGVGFVVEHESGHHRANSEVNNNERSADEHAINTIRKAWEVWEASGYTNNSKFPFAFSLRPEQGGGYILTEHKQPNISTSRKT